MLLTWARGGHRHSKETKLYLKRSESGTQVRMAMQVIVAVQIGVGSIAHEGGHGKLISLSFEY